MLAPLCRCAPLVSKVGPACPLCQDPLPGPRPDHWAVPLPYPVSRKEFSAHPDTCLSGGAVPLLHLAILGASKELQQHKARDEGRLYTFKVDAGGRGAVGGRCHARAVLRTVHVQDSAPLAMSLRDPD